MFTRFVFVASLALIALAAAIIAVYIAYSARLPIPDHFDFEVQRDALIQAQNQIYRYIFEIFVTVVTVIAALSAILGVGAYAILKSRVEKLVEQRVEKVVSTSQARTQAWGLNEFAFAFSQRYERTLQRKLRGDKLDGESLREAIDLIEAARDSAMNGEMLLRDLSPDLRSLLLKSFRNRRLLVNLQNQFLYSTTAMLIMTGEVPGKEMLSELDERSDELLESAVDQSLVREKFEWWQAVETVGFYKIQVGQMVSDQGMINEGKRLIGDIAKGRRLRTYLMPPPSSWSVAIATEYKENKIGLD